MRYAYTPVIRDGIRIGRADDGTGGYSPCPEFGTFPSYQEARIKADELNDALGLSKMEAWEIVTSTMSFGR